MIIIAIDSSISRLQGKLMRYKCNAKPTFALMKMTTKEIEKRDYQTGFRPVLLERCQVKISVCLTMPTIILKQDTSMALIYSMLRFAGAAIMVISTI